MVDVNAIKTTAKAAGGCNGCNSRANVLKISINGIEVRFCSACWDAVKKAANAADRRRSFR